VVAANTHAEELFPLLQEVAQCDPSALVRQHALWATAVMAPRVGEGAIATVKVLLDRSAHESDKGVQDELLTLRTQLRNFA
jgi:hypothetical protein